MSILAASQRFNAYPSWIFLRALRANPPAWVGGRALSGISPEPALDALGLGIQLLPVACAAWVGNRLYDTSNKVIELSKTMGGLPADVKTLTNDIRKVEKEVRELKYSVAELKGLPNEVNELKSSVAGLISSVAELKGVPESLMSLSLAVKALVTSTEVKTGVVKTVPGMEHAPKAMDT
jgi:uncharacterized protein YoxC